MEKGIPFDYSLYFYAFAFAFAPDHFVVVVFLNLTNVIYIQPGVITWREHLPKTSKMPPLHDLVIAM